MTLFVKLLNMSLCASVLLAVLLLVRAVLLRRIPRGCMHLLWLLATIALVCPYRVPSQFSIFSTTEPILSVVEHHASSVTKTVQVVTADGLFSSHPADETGEAVTGVPEFTVEGTEAETVKPGEVPSALPYVANLEREQAGGAQMPSGRSYELLDVGMTIWLVGCGGMLCYAAVQYLRLKKRVAVSVPFVDGVYLCDAIDTPFVLGFLPPKIFLPSVMAEGDFCPVIAHEKAHIRRGDPFWKIIGYAILCLHWFNPLLWLCYPLFCSDLEFACDERAVRDLDSDERRAYAEALLSCSIGGRRAWSISQPLAFGEVGVRERVTAVLHHKSAKWYQITAVVLVCTLLGGCFLTEPIRGYTDVLRQNGYTVHKTELYQTLDITVDVQYFQNYVRDGADVIYDTGDVVVYEHAPTTLSLTEVLLANDPDQYWMNFTYSYSAIPSEGILTTILRPEYKDGDVTLWSSIPDVVGDVRDASFVYNDSADCCYEERSVTFGVLFDREVLENAQEYIAFTVNGMSDIHFTRGEKNPADEIIVTESGVVGYDYTVWYESGRTFLGNDGTLSLDAFPGVTFSVDEDGVYAEEHGVKTVLISGMPVRNVFLSDLTGDGKPEFCASVFFGSGIVDEHIEVYDYTTGELYTLWERGSFDFRLEEVNHTLYAVLSEYNGRELLRGALTMTRHEGGGYVLTVGQGGEGDPLLRTFDHAAYYVSERCLYMSPLSSFAAIGGNSEYRYLIDPDRRIFIQIQRGTGSIQTLGSLIGGWKDFPWTDAEWTALVENPISPIVTTPYTERKYLYLGGDHHLLSMDGELWLMKTGTHGDGTDFIWSIYALIPEEEKGEAYYQYAPMMSSVPPQMTITFDLPKDMILSAGCTDSPIAWIPADGQEIVWDFSQYTEAGDRQMYWTPAKDGDVLTAVEYAEITFTAHNDDVSRYCAGTIYITLDTASSTNLRKYYHVTVVGNGVTVSQDADGYGIVITHRDS